MADVRPKAATDRQVGPHRVRIELPDVLYVQLNGDVEREHSKVFIDAVGEFPARVYVLRDARKSGIVTRQAREFMLNNMPAAKLVAFISFGASFQGRTVITMIAKAVRLLRQNSPIVGFTNTENEARAWIDKIRADARP
jgi:hypothetical protein